MTTPTFTSQRTLTLTAWALMLLASLLPDIICREFFGGLPGWLFPARLILLAVFFALTFLLKIIRPMRAFSVVLFTLHAAPALLNRFNYEIPFLTKLLGSGSFITCMQPEQFGKLAVSLAMIAILFLLGFRFKSMFLVPGKLNAPITPVKWLGFPKPESWIRFGGQYSIYLSVGVGLVLWLTSRTPTNIMTQTLSLLPAILLMAAMNAFNEEVLYRSAVLAPLESVIGKQHTWGISAAFFGIAHFYGVPYGWLGILLAGFMGWILTKAMLETRGFCWTWWIHFLQDVVIFFFLAAGTIVPGG
jgi:hypothetical protein